MKKTFSSKKSAFSLIELSIVLIIIGLLIAGITGGASLIKSAQLRSVIGEARAYAVTVNAFYTQFNGLPGDYGASLTAGTAGPLSYGTAGNNDGQIPYFHATASESFGAWLQLKSIGALDNTSLSSVATTGINTSATLSGVVIGNQIPGSKVSGAAWLFDYNTGVSAVAGTLQNVVVLTAIPTAASTSSNSLVNGTLISVPVISAPDTLSIDTKIDDGISNTGKVRAVGGSNCYGQTSPYSYATGAASTGKVCALSYQVDVNS